ncbi:MAG: GC-type dockerin domain-anchored protein, partial [Planctomycetota bacterium]
LVGPGGDAHIWDGAVDNSWQTPANWTNGLVPGNADAAIVDLGPFVNIALANDTAHLASLYIGGSHSVMNVGNRIDVTNSGGETTFAGWGSGIFLNEYNGGAVGFETNTLSMESDSILYSAGGRTLIHDQLTMTGDARVRGRGLIEVNSPNIGAFNGLGGSYIQPIGGELTIEVNGGGSFVRTPLVDLLDAGSSLTIDAPYFLPMNDIDMGEDTTFNSVRAWELDGTLNANAGNGNTSYVTGAPFDVFGVVDVDSGTLVIESTVDFESGSNIQVSNSDVLELAGDHTAFAGSIASVGFAGHMRMNGMQGFGKTWQGDIDLAAGTLEVNGPQIGGWSLGGNLEFGSAFGIRSRVSGDAPLYMTGDISVPGVGGIIDNTFDLRSTGSMNIAQATGSMLVNGTLIQRNGGDITGNGFIEIADTGAMTSTEPSILAVDIDNAGLFDASAILDPTGYVYINGAYTQAATGRLVVDIEGAAPTDRDVYETSLGATLAGEIYVELHAGYTPVIGQTFDVFTANGGVSGSFDAVVGEPGFEVSQLGNTIVLEYVGVAECPADLSGDGVVDGADLAMLLAAWGGASKTADFTGDLMVDGADLAVLLAAWGGCS